MKRNYLAGTQLSKIDYSPQRGHRVNYFLFVVYERTVGDRLTACASQLYFLRDCCAQSNNDKGRIIFDLTPEGSRGLCWHLDVLAQEIENVANELNSNDDSMGSLIRCLPKGEIGNKRWAGPAHLFRGTTYGSWNGRLSLSVCFSHWEKDNLLLGSNRFYPII
jgi:hypothetical protein